MNGWMTGSWKRAGLLLAVLALLWVTAACGAADAPASRADGKLRITATTGMIADVAAEIGGERVEVTGLMKAGVDPHLYKASQGDIKRLEQADLILYNGLHLEGKMAEVLEKLGKKKTVVAVSRDIDPAKLRASQDGSTQYDPHIWFDVRHWMSAAGTIAAELAKEDPAHAGEYKARADAYLAKLQELHEYAKRQIASIPESGRVLVTAHDAFQYFGAAYGIEVRGLQGISTASEAGAKDVSALRDFLVERKIKAVFVESSVPKKTIEAVISGAKQQGHTVAVGGELFSDAMGEAGTPEGTYIGMVRHNVDTIVSALK
ncbi:metal ABC transporter solute-binding protein, Zn/Mn family [Gorillibacterium sp. sgz5001074]|uniref:metal ABC transporter solute-binding protein, Zn/Mn family n=1 Tax=Gorillibacterium sp. sgz5001074 TaxID=3446695 RepID=UPI003F67A1DE